MRVVVERAFGKLKARWRILGEGGIFSRNLDYMIQIIYVCCLLHNICIEYLDFWELNDNDEVDVNDDFEYSEIENEGNSRRLELV
jgi:hypothetical protein